MSLKLDDLLNSDEVISRSFVIPRTVRYWTSGGWPETAKHIAWGEFSTARKMLDKWSGGGLANLDPRKGASNGLKSPLHHPTVLCKSPRPKGAPRVAPRLLAQHLEAFFDPF